MRQLYAALVVVKLDKLEMNKLFDILRGVKLLHARHECWLKTVQGVEDYPLDPTRKQYDMQIIVMIV